MKKNFLIRGIREDLFKKIKENSVKEKISMNKFVKRKLFGDKW